MLNTVVVGVNMHACMHTHQKHGYSQVMHAQSANLRQMGSEPRYITKLSAEKLTFAHASRRHASATCECERTSGQMGRCTLGCDPVGAGTHLDEK